MTTPIVNERLSCYLTPAYHACTLRFPGAPITLDSILAAQTALAPLIPIFKVIGLVEKLINMLPVPTPLQIEELLEDIGDITSVFAPAVAVPRLAVDVLDCVILYLQQALSRVLELQAFKAELVGIAAYVTSGLGAGRLDLANRLACSQAALDRDYSNLADQLQALNEMLAIVAAMLSLAGVSVTVPDMSGVSGTPLDDLTDDLTAVITALNTARNAIPI